MAQAIYALSNFSGETASQVLKQEERVNSLEVEIDRDLSTIIARRQPTARDLRLLIAVSKTIGNLERIGDEAAKIARMSKNLHSRGPVTVNHFEMVRSIAASTTDMLHDALDAFARLDLLAAADVVRTDQEVDAEFKSAVRQLITFMMEDPRTISRSLDMIFIAKAIERIGDHSKNISEYVVYMVKGRDVRHIGIEEIEREIRS